MNLGVLITYFREKELLRECIESLMGGTGRPDEILIYDNGADVPATNYLPTGLPVRVITGTGNNGPSFSRNALLRESRSRYVHYQDADDLFEPGFALALQQRIAMSDSVDLIVNQFNTIGRDGVVRRDVLPLDLLKDRNSIVRFALEHGFNTQCATHRRQMLLDVGGWDDSLWHKEDVDVCLRMGLAGATYAIINEPLIRIRTGRPASHSSNSMQAAQHSLQFLYKVMRLVPSGHNDLIAEYAATCACWLFHCGLDDDAETAMAIGTSLGRPRLSALSPPVRACYRCLGGRNTERMRRIYRSIKRVIGAAHD